MVYNVDQDEVVYEPPVLIEVGAFTELTRGEGFESMDAFDFADFFSGF